MVSYLNLNQTRKIHLCLLMYISAVTCFRSYNINQLRYDYLKPFMRSYANEGRVRRQVLAGHEIVTPKEVGRTQQQDPGRYTLVEGNAVDGVLQILRSIKNGIDADGRVKFLNYSKGNIVRDMERLMDDISRQPAKGNRSDCSNATGTGDIDGDDAPRNARYLNRNKLLAEPGDFTNGSGFGRGNFSQLGKTGPAENCFENTSGRLSMNVKVTGFTNFDFYSNYGNSMLTESETRLIFLTDCVTERMNTSRYSEKRNYKGSALPNGQGPAYPSVPDSEAELSKNTQDGRDENAVADEAVPPIAGGMEYDSDNVHPNNESLNKEEGAVSGGSRAVPGAFDEPPKETNRSALNFNRLNVFEVQLDDRTGQSGRIVPNNDSAVGCTVRFNTYSPVKPDSQQMALPTPSVGDLTERRVELVYNDSFGGTPSSPNQKSNADLVSPKKLTFNLVKLKSKDDIQATDVFNKLVNKLTDTEKRTDFCDMDDSPPKTLKNIKVNLRLANHVSVDGTINFNYGPCRIAETACARQMKSTPCDRPVSTPGFKSHPNRSSSAPEIDYGKPLAGANQDASPCSPVVVIPTALEPVGDFVENIISKKVNAADNFNNKKIASRNKMYTKSYIEKNVATNSIFKDKALQSCCGNTTFRKGNTKATFLTTMVSGEGVKPIDITTSIVFKNDEDYEDDYAFNTKFTTFPTPKTIIV